MTGKKESWLNYLTKKCEQKEGWQQWSWFIMTISLKQNYSLHFAHTKPTFREKAHEKKTFLFALLPGKNLSNYFSLLLTWYRCVILFTYISARKKRRVFFWKLYQIYIQCHYHTCSYVMPCHHKKNKLKLKLYHHPQHKNFALTFTSSIVACHSLSKKNLQE